MNEETPLYYRVDEENRIVEVGGSWDEAALVSDAPEVTAVNIEGTNLFSYIVGKATRDFVWTMLDAVRKLQQPSTKLYRCDRPSIKRNLEMSIRPDGDTLIVEHCTKSIEPYDRSFLFRAAGSSIGVQDILIRCSMCNNLRHETQWLPPDEHPVGAQTDNANIRDVIYSVCDECRENVKSIRAKR